MNKFSSFSNTRITYGVEMVGSSGSAYFRDLGPLIDMDPAFDSEDFWPGALDACGDRDGQILGIPLLINISGIFFDEGAFDTEGVPRPRPGWTWEDFRKEVLNCLEQADQNWGG